MIDFLYNLTADQWSAFGQWFGSIGTFCAVIVSLKLAREAKINSSPKVSIIDSLYIDEDEFFSIDLKIVNVGLVPTTLETALIRKTGRKGKVISDNLSLRKDFPLRIEPGHALMLKITVTELLWLKNIGKVSSEEIIELVLVDSLNNTFRKRFKTP